MMKKMVALFLVLCLVIGLVACGKQKQTDNKETKPSANTEQTTAPTKETAKPTTAPTNPTKATTKPTTPAPTAPQKKVNIEKLKSIEQKDTFGVKVTGVELSKDYYTLADGVSMDGYDAMLVTLKNSTGKKISGFSVLVLATDSNGKDVVFAGLTPITPVGTVQNYSKCVSVMGTEKADMANDAQETYAIRCSMSRFANVNIIPYSYTDADGKEIINENSHEWLENTLAVEVK